MTRISFALNLFGIFLALLWFGPWAVVPLFLLSLRLKPGHIGFRIGH